MTKIFKVDYLKDTLKPAIDAYGWEIGDYTYCADGRPKIIAPDAAKLKVGKFCSLAAGIHIFLGANHRTDWVTTYPFPAIEGWPEAHAIEGHPATNGDVVIGNDVYIGSGAWIMSGVTIGDGAVIAARSVVAGDVAPYSIVGGNPAKPIRKRFDDATIAHLLNDKWWNWPEQAIRTSLGLLCAAPPLKSLSE